jgi:ATP synthase protein I
VLGSDRGKQLKAFARIGSVGIELALSTVLGLLGGQWLDKKLSTAPYLTVIGLLLGITAGFRSLIQVARRKPNPPQDGPPE